MWRNLFTVVGKMKLYQFTVYENKIGICAFSLYSSNFCNFKKVHIFICIKTYDEKSCKTTRIANNRALILLVYPTKPTEELLSIKILHSNPSVVNPSLLEDLLSKE